MRVIVLAGILLLGSNALVGAETGTKSGAEAGASAIPVVHFTAKDFAFEGPDTIPSGMTTLVLHNNGPSLHHLMLMRLENGKTVEDLKAAVAALKPTDMPPTWAVPAGGVNPPMPGSDTRATLDIEPGHYAVVCFVDVPDHIPHIMKGMIRGLTVTKSTKPSAAPPASDLTVTEIDFGFVPSAPFTAGHHVVKVENKGKQPHELGLIRLGEGKTLDDLAAWGATYAGPLPGTSLGGAAPMMPGQVEYVPFDLTPGNYALLCFVIDPKTGKPHLAEGMALPFAIP